MRLAARLLARIRWWGGRRCLCFLLLSYACGRVCTSQMAAPAIQAVDSRMEDAGRAAGDGDAGFNSPSGSIGGDSQPASTPLNAWANSLLEDVPDDSGAQVSVCSASGPAPHRYLCK